jgi:hypothetical protein
LFLSKLMKKLSLIISSALAIPVLALAAVQLGSFRDLVGLALTIVAYLMQAVFAIFSLGIIYTVFRYINALNKGDAKVAEEMRNRLIWAIVGMAVLFSLWGIIAIFTGTLGWQNGGIPQLSAPQ